MSLPVETVTIQITTRIPVELGEQLNILCTHEKRSKANVLTLAVEAYIADYFAKNPELPFAE